MSNDNVPGITGFIPTNMNAGGAYAHSFGMLNSETKYKGGLEDYNINTKSNDVDLRPNLKEMYVKGYSNIHRKALGPETGGAGTAGYALSPIFVDQRIIDISRKFTPLREQIQRVTNQGMTADYNELSAKGGAFTAGLDAALDETNDTYDRKSQSIKYLYAVGRTLGPMQAAMPPYILDGFTNNGAGNNTSAFTNAGAPSARQVEIQVKARSLMELEENLILNGNATTSGVSGNPDGTEFNGIIQQLSTTNQTDKGGADIDFEDIETTVKDAWDASGRPNLMVAGSSVFNKIRSMMIDQFRYTPADFTNTGLLFGVPSGITVNTIAGPILVIPSQFLANTATSRRLLILDTSVIEMRVLQDMMFQEMGINNDSNKFFLKIYECLILRAPSFCASIINIL